ncbi:uncharacterized protein BJ212DRAFT_401711 [Suillus subaureus]|uniref:Chromo domain-containing protein n=3 Tax=Suillus TaxID=5379 RepID=A0A9P7E8M9_9AGAM|nr:uncharacterized protein BJ212DRAFT_401711 [Suillus subaureus]KAG1813614.1 hypothetical protein BJ212DRAFT_401711 [Suillus subaureus]
MSTQAEPPAGELSEFETQFEPRSNDDDALWEVIEIVAERGKKYRVRWAGNDPKTGRPWPLDWVPKHDCTDHLVEEWKRKKAVKGRRSNKTGGQKTASRASTFSKVSATSTSRKSRSLAGESVLNLTDYDEPPRAQPLAISKTQSSSSKRKHADMAKEPSNLSDSVDPSEPEHPKKKKKLVTGEPTSMKLKRKATQRTPASHSQFIESDADDNIAAAGGVGDGIPITRVGPPTRKRPVPKSKDDVLSSVTDHHRVTTTVTVQKPEQSSGSSRNGQPFSKNQPDVIELSSTEEADLLLKSKKPPISRFADRKTASKTAPQETTAKHVVAQSSVRSHITTPAILHSRKSSSVSPLPLRRQPSLSPGARARLEIFDCMMGIGSDNGDGDPYANMGENADYGAADPYDTPLGPPPKSSTPPPTTATTAGRKKPTGDSPFSGIVPETESSQSQPSLPNHITNGKRTDQPPPLKQPSLPRSTSRKSQSASVLPTVASSSEVPLRPRKPPAGPVPRISPHTFRKTVESLTTEHDNEPPMSSIESFPSPQKDKGKQRCSGPDKRSSDEDPVPGVTDAELKARGKALYERALRKKELLQVTDKPPKKTINDLVRSRVPLAMTSKDKQSGPDTHPFASNNGVHEGEFEIVQQMEDAYVDLSGGNSTTIDTFTQSGPQDKEAQRILLREEEEECTQEALLSGNPALLVPKVDVVEKFEARRQELAIDDTEMGNNDDGVQPPPVPAEPGGSNHKTNQPSTHIDDLQVASMIANPSQGQRQGRDDEDFDTSNIHLNSSPTRSVPQHDSDATVRRLNQALTTLHKKSDEIQALQAALALEREKTSKLEAEVKAVWQSPSTAGQEGIAPSAQPVGAMQTNSAVSELADMRVKWNQEREVWEAGRRNWEEEIVRLTAERDRFETNARSVDELKASWDADQATFRRERELWENERKKLDLQVAEMLGERIGWVEERDRLAAQIESLTETGATFKAVRAQWEQEQTIIMVERAAWVEERESWAQQRTASARERALWDIHREAMELRSIKWEADHAEWVRGKELWESEREKWSAERASMIEAHEALVADVTRSNSSLDALTRSKSLAEKDRDFFRDQYTQASGFVSATRTENIELEQKAKVAEGQARDGVALIKHMFESQIKALKEDVDRWRGVSALLQEKDRRTDDLIRRRAAEHPELAERCRQLERQVDSLRADLIELGRVHQKSSVEPDKIQDLKLSEPREHNRVPDFHSVKLSYTELEPGEIIELNGLSDPDTSFLSQADALEVDVNSEEAEEEECGLYPCKWKTGADIIGQCQQSFDCREAHA